MSRIAIAFLTLTLPAVSFALPLTSLGNLYNAMIFGNLTGGGGDTEGRLMVGGNATYPNSYSVGVAVVGTALPASATRDDLVVFGNLSTVTNWGVNGNAVVGGSIIGSGVSHISAGASTRIQANITFDTVSGNALSDGSGVTLAQLQTQASNNSTSYGALAEQGVVTKQTSFGTLTLTGNHSTLNVFNISAADFANLTIDITAPSGSTVLINIAGSSVTASGGSIQLHGVTRQHVVYNFYQATSLNISSREVEGSLLAPFLTSSTFSGGSINGIGVLGGAVNQINGFEFHNFRFDGDLPSGDNPVPEPASFVLFSAAGLAAACYRKLARIVEN